MDAYLLDRWCGKSWIMSSFFPSSYFSLSIILLEINMGFKHFKHFFQSLRGFFFFTIWPVLEHFELASYSHTGGLDLLFIQKIQVFDSKRRSADRQCRTCFLRQCWGDSPSSHWMSIQPSQMVTAQVALQVKCDFSATSVNSTTSLWSVHWVKLVMLYFNGQEKIG